MARAQSTAPKDSTAHLGFEAKLWLAVDTFRRFQHPDLRADAVLTTSPFNDSDVVRKDDAMRWHGAAAGKEQPQVGPQGAARPRRRFGVPLMVNATVAWPRRASGIIHHLAPQGTAGFVLANASMSSNQSGGGDIRQKLVEADLVDGVVALPGHVVHRTQITVCFPPSGRILRDNFPTFPWN